MQRSSYPLSEFNKYHEINKVMPKHLEPYCCSEIYYSPTIPDIGPFEDKMNEIISSIIQGQNPNDIIFRNLVKLYLKKICHDNFSEYLQRFKSLDYSSSDNIKFLASELLICAFRCPISVKGFTFQEDTNIKSLPEICADIVKQFSTLVVNINDVKVDFHGELMKMCEHYFMDFISLNSNMDENNENTSDNFRGLMSFMGLLYSRGIMNIKVVTDCFDLIKHSIFNHNCQHNNSKSKHNCMDYHDQLLGPNGDSAKRNTICYFDCDRINPDDKKICVRKHIECLNLHKGYEHLINHVVHSMEIRVPDLIRMWNEKQDLLNSHRNVFNNMNMNNFSNNRIDRYSKYVSGKKVGQVCPMITHPELMEVTLDSCLHLVDVIKASGVRVNMEELIKKIIMNEISQLEDQVHNIKISLDKLVGYLDIIIKNHQEMIDLHMKYKSMNKNQLVQPFRPFVVMTHNMIGSNLNKLHNKFGAIGHKCKAEYQPPK